MRRILASIALLGMLFLACARADAFELMDPSTWSWPQYDWHSFKANDPGSWPFIPVPEVTTDPNGGVTYGVLPVWLNTDNHDDVTSIFAPDINSNSTLGPGGSFRYLGYPSADTQWYVVTSAQVKIARKVDLDFKTGREHKHWWSFEARFFFERDPTERFYGLGNVSLESNQTNYTTEQVYGVLNFGINITDQLQLSVMERPRYVRIQEGGFNSVPDITELFPHQKGINGGTEVLTQAMLQYDTRDSVDIPHAGGLARIYYGIADRAFMSSVSYNRFGGELRRYLSVGERITFAGHVFCEWEPAGNEMPFWSQARLGGDESLLTDQETLRGYGTGRFIDNNLFVMNLEMRTRVWEKKVFGTQGILELAPFVEAGRVGHDMSYDPFQALHPVGGLGIRGIAQPFVVGYVDVGWGNEGAAVFSGIDYPF